MLQMGKLVGSFYVCSGLVGCESPGRKDRSHWSGRVAKIGLTGQGLSRLFICLWIPTNSWLYQNHNILVPRDFHLQLLNVQAGSMWVSK